MWKPPKNGILFLNLNSDNHGQKSWDKFTFVALFHTRQTNSQARIYLHMFSPFPSLPPSLYNVGHVYTLCLQRFNILLIEGGGGGKATHFETENSAFF